MNNDAFKKLYSKLNTAQKQAVDTIEGPVMVVAGPGTGKTQILTLRIANILLQTQVNPENILALTFTESGVLAMRKRLVDMIGTPGYKVEISTFHGFCNDIIRNNPEEFPDLISSEAVTEIEQIQILEDILRSLDLKLIKPFGDQFYYLRSALSAINDLKKEGVTVEVFAKGIEASKKDFESTEDLLHDKGKYKGQMKGKYQTIQKEIAKNEELLKVYDKYQQSLREKKYYDFNDMLLEVLAALDLSEGLLLRLQEQFQYVLVDEHQDTNFAQNRLIELLCSFYDVPNLFVVGDEKQAIFRFQGASLENFLYFQKLYPSAKLINLENNYRSTQTILSAAGSLIKQNITTDIIAKNTDLKANTSYTDEPIQIATLNDYHAEYHFLTTNIQQKIKDKVSAREMAILVRNNRDLLPVVEALEQYQIPFTIESDQNLFSDLFIKKLLLLFNTIAAFGEDGPLVKALHIDFLDFSPLDIFKLMNHARKNHRSIYEIIYDDEITEELKLRDRQKIINFIEVLQRWKTSCQNDSLEQLYISVLKDSGLLKYILQQPRSLDILDKFASLYEEIKTLTAKHNDFGLTDFLSYINLLQDHDVMLKRPVRTTIIDSVRLMTAHRSKGLEFDYVYIPQAYDSHWGNTRKRSAGFKLPFEYLGIKLKLEVALEANEDERRLFYVCLTRARKGVTISYATRSLEGKEQVPSQFISEIDEEFKSSLDISAFENNFLSHKEIMFDGLIGDKPDFNTNTEFLKNIEFFKGLFLERGLSVSALNNFLKCPWRFFYQNLLLLPDVKSNSAIFGTAVHRALSHYVRALPLKNASLESALVIFNETLRHEAPSKTDFEVMMNKGTKVLTDYFGLSNHLKPEMLSELYIRGVHLSDDVTLNGMIDLIEPINKSSNVIVYDFKTGKPKTRRDIEGLNAASSGNYMRQLLFYKILLDGYHGAKYKMEKGGIIFVEADAKGAYHQELFDIDPLEVEALKEQIFVVAKQINLLSFWDSRCGEKECPYCSLRDIAKSN